MSAVIINWQIKRVVKWWARKIKKLKYNRKKINNHYKEIWKLGN